MLLDEVECAVSSYRLRRIINILVKKYIYVHIYAVCALYIQNVKSVRVKRIYKFERKIR